MGCGSAVLAPCGEVHQFVSQSHIYRNEGNDRGVH